MPGIVGLVSDDGFVDPVAPAGPLSLACTLERMVQPLLRSPLLAADWQVAGRAGLGGVTLRQGGSPLAHGVGPRGPAWLAFFGAVHLDEHLSDPRPLAEQLLERYFAAGPERGRQALCGLNGTYALALWEPDLDRLTLINDRLGYGKLHIWQHGSRLMFASEYKAFTWHPDFPREIDPVTVADLFLFHHPLEERTLFRQVRCLPPASLLTFERGRLSQETYWSFSDLPDPGPELPDEVYADELAERFRAAALRRVRPNACILLTGGLDSRIVAGMTAKVAPHSGLVAATLGIQGRPDVQVGRALAQALGLPHFHIPLGDDYVAQWSGPAAWKTEGKNPAYASWIMAQGPEMQSRGLRYTLTGLFGNSLSGRAIPREALNLRTVEEGLALVEAEVQPLLGILRRIMRPEVFAAAALESAATPGQIFCRVEVDHLLRRFDAFNFRFIMARNANTDDALGDYAQSLETIIDRDVFDYAVGAIAPRARGRALFYYHLITRHLPEAAQVINGNSGLSVQAELALKTSPWLNSMDVYRGKLLRRLFPQQYNREARGSIPHNQAIRAGSREFVCDLLRQSETYAEWFDPRAVQALLDDHLAGRADVYLPLAALVTFILWRKQFVEEQVLAE